MNIESQKISDLHGSIKIIIEKDDYIEEVEKNLKKIRKNTHIKGFRPGMAPLPLVAKIYRKTVLLEEVQEILQQKINNFIKENNLDILEKPLVVDDNIDSIIENEENPTFVFTLEYAIKPDFELPLTKDDKFKYYNIIVDEKSLNNYINSLKKTYGQYINVDKVNENSLVAGVLFECDKNENEPIKNVTLLISQIKDNDIRDQFIGKTINDTITFDIVKAFPNEKDLAFLLDNKKFDTTNGLILNFKIKYIKDFKEAEINQELWDAIFGTNVVKSYDEFIELIKNQIKFEKQILSDKYFKNEILNSVIEKTKIDFPIDFLKKYYEKEIINKNEEFKEEKFNKYLEDLKFALILRKIVKDFNIKVDKQILKEEAKKVLKERYSYYGLINLPEDYIEKTTNSMLNDTEEYESLTDIAYQNKIVEALKELVTIEEVEVTSEEFFKSIKNSSI